MWKKHGTAGQSTDDNIIWRMYLERWILRLWRHTHRKSSTSFFCTATMVTQMHLNFSITCTLYVLFYRNVLPKNAFFIIIIN